MTDTITITDQTLADDLTRYADLQARISQLTEQLDGLKGRLRDQLGTTERTAGGYKVTIKPQRRFTVEQAQQVLPVDWFKLCTVTAVTPAAAKKILPPALFEACMVESGEPRVVVTAI